MNFDLEKYTLHNVSSKIPTPVFLRSSSFRVAGEKGNLSSSVPNDSAISENAAHNGPEIWKRNLTPLNLSRIRSMNKNLDEDIESVGSVASNFSTSIANSTCEHAHFAKNGTTFSGKSHKYIVHCSSGLNDPEEYLTPTQRANRNIKRLKTLLQLAKEKLREKEAEIFNLKKEVVELKLYKATIESTNNSPLAREKDPLEIQDEIDFNAREGTSQDFNQSFSVEKFSEISPIKHVRMSPAKMSPAFSLDEIGDKASFAPDFFLSSLADSGNFDDLPSSASIYSKDSVSFVATPELKHVHDEHSTAFNEILNDEAEEKLKIVRIYEKKLGEKKLEYEAELNKVINEQEEKNMKIIHEFERKLKDEELKFELRWKELLKATEEEKMMIVSRFEEKLEEEKVKYRENLRHNKSQDEKVTDMVLEMTYSQKVEEEKNIYETSLMDIKQNFENERAMIEEKFDEAMKTERLKFEESLKKIKEVGDQQVAELTKKVSDLEMEYFELLPKYEKAVSRSQELAEENELLKASLNNQEETQRKVYLELYNKGHEAARIEVQQEEELSEISTKKVSVPELFAQLKITEVELENLKDKEYREAHCESQSLCLLSSKEAISLWMLAARKAMYKRLAEAQAKSAQKEKSGSDPEATLQFLKSAVYYFLTDRENHLGHLKAIESILAFSSTEKSNIEKYYLNRY